MEKTIFGIKGKVFYCVCSDYSTGDLYFMEELMPHDIIGQKLDVAPPVYEIIISNEKDFMDFIDYSLMESDFRTISITEEIHERWKNESWEPGIFIGNFDSGGDEELQKQITESLKNGYN